MAPGFRWGIISTGRIAHVFANALAELDDAELLAVGSRTDSAAQAFGEKYGIARRYGSYEELASDPDLDAVYIATPHPFHRANALLCLDKGKAVLCEKPFTINAAEARELIDRARRRKVFLMEAMWTRFLPAMGRLREMIAEGVIGEIEMVTADFGFRAPFDAKSRLFDPVLGGGALLDVGVYPVSFASMLLGRPTQVRGVARIGETGVDESNGISLLHEGGGIALLSSAIRTGTGHVAEVVGSKGRIRIPSPWFRAERLVLSIAGEEERVIEAPISGNGYAYEARELMRGVRAGRLESEILPLSETLSIMETMDILRKEWGLRYPSE